jgi:hypothetical protein
MALFDNPTIVKVAPDPRLRASLVALKGTPGEAAINAVLTKNSKISSIRYYDFNNASSIAGAQGDPNNKGKTIININVRYQYEDFRVLAPTMSHEALHLDSKVTAREERIAHDMEAMIYGKFVLENPSLAQSKTELARRENTQLMGRLNSRDTNGNLRLYTGQGNIFPAPAPYDRNDPSQTSAPIVTNFAASFEGPFTASSPGNTVLQQEVKALTGITNKKTLQKVGFNAYTENLLNQNQKVFTPAQLVQLAQALKLDTVSNN